MATDVRRLRGGELCRLLNSTLLGECLGERQFHRHRNRAGLRIAAEGDPQRIDLLRYLAWLFDQRHAPAPECGADAATAPSAINEFNAHRERARLRNALLSIGGREIGDLPPEADPDRKRASARDFRGFCERYLPQTFHLKWSPDHLKVISKIEAAVLEGGLFAMAMPRGSGKTSLCETACLWALLYGHREFVALIGSDEEHAANMLDSIKAELENSDLLLADFPEVCYPIRKLEGIHQRAAGQLFRGKQTHIGWTARELVLPTIQGSSAAGGIIRVAGITGRVRGMKYKRPDGAAVRPSLVLVDDPQTDESARSPAQCMSRERVLAGAVLGLAGPGTKIAGLMTLTVVRPGDLADRLLDRDKHPQWQGERTKMVYELPKNEGLWAKYAQLRGDGLRAERGTKEATEFYAANREKMDAGARVGWEERFNPDELSAIQHAMNLRIDDAIAFQAEYQNDPIPEDSGGRSELTVEDICARTNGHAPEVIPHGATKLTAFIDVQQKALFWLVAAWEENFTGSVVAYGTEPDQKSEWFTLKDIRRTLEAAKPGAGLEGTVYAGLERLTASLLGREWRVDSGGTMRIDRCLIDANWGQSTEVVYQFCRQSEHAALVIPSHGRYVGAASRPFAEYKQGRGERVGLNWRIPPMTGRRAVKHVVFDSNWWKSFIVARLSAPVGDPGCLMLHGKGPRKHLLLAEHLTAEYRVQTQGRGRTVDEWKLRAGGADNHWLDCLVGATVAASMEGATLPGTGMTKARPRRVSFAQMQREAWKRRGVCEVHSRVF